MSSHALRHVIDGSLTFAFSDHTCRLNVRLSRDAHHDSLQLTQLTVVWNPRLHNDSEGAYLHLQHSIVLKRLWLLHQNLSIAFGTHGADGTAAPGC
jgi:hypothetical protein